MEYLVSFFTGVEAYNGGSIWFGDGKKDTSSINKFNKILKKMVK